MNTWDVSSDRMSSGRVSLCFTLAVVVAVDRSNVGSADMSMSSGHMSFGHMRWDKNSGDMNSGDMSSRFGNNSSIDTGGDSQQQQELLHLVRLKEQTVSMTSRANYL